MTLVIRRPLSNTLRLLATSPRLGAAANAMHSAKGQGFLLRRIHRFANSDSNALGRA